MTYEDAKRAVRECHDEYERHVEEGCGEHTAMELALEGLGNEDLLALIWGSGAVSEAFASVIDDVEQAVAYL